MFESFFTGVEWPTALQLAVVTFCVGVVVGYKYLLSMFRQPMTLGKGKGKGRSITTQTYAFVRVQAIIGQYGLAGPVVKDHDVPWPEPYPISFVEPELEETPRSRWYPKLFIDCVY